jgi:uncharacterized damage-inducible protein DinB
MPATLLDQYRRWFAYEKDSHRKVLASLETVPPEGRESEPYRKALNLVGHLLAARRIWLHRLDASRPRPAAVFPADVRLEGLAGEFEAMERDWEEYLGRLTGPELESTVSYATMEGDRYSNVLADIFAQLHGHSNYHRGQIASLIRAAGGEPARTDFIFWTRKEGAAPG